MEKIDPEVSPKALNDLGQLASAVGHNVINAFSAIVSNAELLRLKLGPNTPPIDPSTLADMIIDSALEASTVARLLIDYTRPITTIGSDRVSLDRLVAEYVEAVRLSDPDDGMTCSTSLQPIPPIYGEASQLTSMIDHLVANAREACSDGIAPEVHFSTSVDSRGWVTLEIRDNGRGMTAEIQERAVEPFYSTKIGHLGVGLSIANGIWRRHRGTLSIKNHQEGGVVLRLCVEPCEA